MRAGATAGLSAYLDWMRVTAALTVFASHLLHPLFGVLPPEAGQHHAGGDAVIVFFVLSGLVIADSARRAPGVGAYLFDRFTRIASVAIPAMALTWAFDRLGAAASPALYKGFADAPLALHIALGAVPASQWMGAGIDLGSNLAFWSLSHEAAYYLLFAAVVWTTGLRRVALLVAGALFFGSAVLLLLPAWLLGVTLAGWIRSGATPGRRVAWVLAIGAPAAYALLLATGAAPAIIDYSVGLRDEAPVYFGYAKRVLWDWIVAGLTSAHVLGVAALLKGRRMKSAERAAWLAGASFSLYLIHMPALAAVFAHLPPEWPLASRLAVMAVATLTTALLFAELFERPLPRVRRFAARIIPGRPELRPSTPPPLPPADAPPPRP